MMLLQIPIFHKEIVSALITIKQLTSQGIQNQSQKKRCV